MKKLIFLFIILIPLNINAGEKKTTFTNEIVAQMQLAQSVSGTNPTAAISDEITHGWGLAKPVVEKLQTPSGLLPLQQVIHKSIHTVICEVIMADINAIQRKHCAPKPIKMLVSLFV